MANAFPEIHKGIDIGRNLSEILRRLQLGDETPDNDDSSTGLRLRMDDRKTASMRRLDMRDWLAQQQLACQRSFALNMNNRAQSRQLVIWAHHSIPPVSSPSEKFIPGSNENPLLPSSVLCKKLSKSKFSRTSVVSSPLKSRLKASLELVKSPKAPAPAVGSTAGVCC